MLQRPPGNDPCVQRVTASAGPYREYVNGMGEPMGYGPIPGLRELSLEEVLDRCRLSWPARRAVAALLRPWADRFTAGALCGGGPAPEHVARYVQHAAQWYCLWYVPWRQAWDVHPCEEPV